MLQKTRYRDVVEEKPYIESLEKKRYRDMAEEEPHSLSLKRKRVKMPHTPQELETPIHPSRRRGCSSVPAKHHSIDSEQIREPGDQPFPEESAAGRSDRVESTQAECQMNQKASFFSSSRDFQVIGSNFNSSRDHITTGNIIINVNGSGRNEIISVGVPEKSTSVEMRRTPQIESVEIRPSEPSVQGKENNNIDVHPAMLKGCLPFLVLKSSQIYYRHLLTLGHGSPLWIPEPSTSLPIDYQKAGIAIGDVGILKDSGGFDFLFNVYQPLHDANHRINPRTMPDDFFPLEPPEERDINSRFEFKDFSFLASSRVNSRRDESSGFIFESSADDGAILTMPKGANSIDLDNMGLLRKYVSKNVQQWYTYANEVRGRDIGNGDLRIVIGRTSATTWGMAAFLKESSSEDPPSCFKFKPTRRGSQNEDFSFNPDVSSPNYGWEYSGNLKAEVKSGPDDHEIQKLRNFDRLRGDKGQMAYENQSLFVRTINVTLQERQRGSPQPRSGWKGWVEVDSSPVAFEDYWRMWGVLEPIDLSANLIAPLGVKRQDIVDGEERDDDMGFDSFLAAPKFEDQIEAGDEYGEDYLGFSIQPEVTEESRQFSSVASFLSSNHSESHSSSMSQLPKSQYSSSYIESDPPSNPEIPLEGQFGFHNDSSSASPLPEPSPTAPSSVPQVQEAPRPVTCAFELSPWPSLRSCSPVSSPIHNFVSEFGPTEDEKNRGGDGQMVQEPEPMNIPLSGSPGPPDSGPPLLSHLHPSKVINELLLNYRPEAIMAITEDSDWIAVLQESDTVFPTDEVLLSRITKRFEVGFEEGVVFLQSRNQDDATS